MSETAGKRLYQVRLACGDGSRKAEPLDAFAARVREITGADYDPSTISLLERMKQKWRLEDVKNFAAVDPLERGEVWLSALQEGPASVETLDPTKDRRLTEQEIQRAHRQLEREQQDRAAASQQPADQRRGRRGGA
jgi:hypothetical protein